RTYIQNFIGKPYLPSSPRVFKSKSKNAQEAHEAIRVTNIQLKGEEVGGRDGMNRDHARLYDLIRLRFIACQMSEAIMEQTSVDITASNYLLRATGSVIKFDGWLKLFGKDIEEETDEEEKKQLLPNLLENQKLGLEK